MASKRAMTLTLGDVEMEALEQLADRKGTTKTAIIRQAIRLYHLMDAKLATGYKLLLVEEEGKGESEIMVL
jgi:hypothetical protein